LKYENFPDIGSTSDDDEKSGDENPVQDLESGDTNQNINLEDSTRTGDDFFIS